MWYKSWVEQGPGESQGKVNGFYLTSADSGLVPVVSLGPLAKVSDHNEANRHLPQGHRHLEFVQEKLQLKWGWLPAISIVSGGM